MSNSNVDLSKSHFDFAFNMHFGALNLLSIAFTNLKQSGVISVSEFERYQKFFKFTTAVISRGHRKFYPELYQHFVESNSSSDESGK